MVTSMIETAITHNFGFHATGLFREAYVAYLNGLYAYRAEGGNVSDLSRLKAVEISHWLRAWMLMEGCGFIDGDQRVERFRSRRRRAVSTWTLLHGTASFGRNP